MKKGTKHSEETRSRIREKRKLQVFSEETRAKFAERQRKLVGDKHPNWKGGKRIMDGYVYIYSPDHPGRTRKGYVCEHRLVMEKKLGRYLDEGEVIHHIDGSRDNNDINNLVLCSSDAKHHSEQHVKLRERDEKGKFKKTKKGN